jgi:PKD repeat protein
MRDRERRFLVGYVIFIFLLTLLVLALLIPYPLARRLPYAAFTYSPTKPIVNMNVTFDASSSFDPDGWIASYKWDFGDGAVITEADSISYHAYSELGAYKVTLVITDNDNLTDSATASITVGKYPVASFVYTPSVVHVEEEVTLDASSSTADGGHITSYKWDFGDGTTATVTASIVTHVYMKVGTYEVRLTVTDSEGLESSTSKMLKVVIGVVIDLYTQHPYPHGGQGLNSISDVFAPHEGVILFAKVTYNEEPLYDRIVSFGVHSPSELFTLSRTATTSIDGIASISFIVPWQYENLTSTIFGTWFVQASVEFMGEIVNDTLTFRVGWIVELIQVEPCDSAGNLKTGFTKEETAYFKVYAENIALRDKNVTVTVAVMDDLNVPIGLVTLNDLVFPPGITTLLVDLEIPIWAFAGVGSVHVNAFTDSLEEDGVAYCPEITATFTIGLPTPPPPPPPPPISWIVELIKVEPCDNAGNIKTNFTKGESTYFKIYVKNNALEEKNVTISVVLMDDLNFPIGQITLNDLMLSPGNTTLDYTLIAIRIPDQAFAGVGSVHVNAFTDSLEEGGVAYCPEMTATFSIEDNS